MTDLFISELVFAPGSGFGAFFTAVGECPALFPALYALAALVYLAASKKIKDKDARKKAFTFFLYAAATVVVTAAVVVILKNLWGRARFTELGENHAGFTPWYLPQGPTGHDSFPSGHAAMSALVFFVSDGIEYFTGKRLRSVDLLCFAFTSAVCVARLIEGAHYLSDLVAGAALAAFFRAVCLRACGIRARIPFGKKVLPINYPPAGGSAVDTERLR